jgi:hypothetical protein
MYVEPSGTEKGKSLSVEAKLLGEKPQYHKKIESITEFLRKPLLAVALQIFFVVVAALGNCSDDRTMMTMRTIQVIIQASSLPIIVLFYPYAAGVCCCSNKCGPLKLSWLVVGVIWLGRTVTIMNGYTLDVCSRHKYCAVGDDDDLDLFSCSCISPCTGAAPPLMMLAMILGWTSNIVQLVALYFECDTLDSFLHIDGVDFVTDIMHST